MTIQINWGIFCYGLILLFGVGLTAAFADGPQRSRQRQTALIFFGIFSILLQSVCWLLFGMDRTKQLYPLIIHLPLLIFMVVGFQHPWYRAVTGVCSAYLCLQIPRWVALLVQSLLKEQIFYYVAYIPAIFLSYYLLRRYVSGPVYRLISQSSRACLLVGAVPFSYYLFDYSTTIYTKWLYSGAVVAAEFIPFVVAIFYFVFVVVYYEETQKQAAAQREREQMETRLTQARTELDNLRRTQDQTRQYRHDMRHHLSYLQALAAEGDLVRIAEYLHAAQSDLENFTPTRYCENETANLLLSSFAARAKQAGVPLTVTAELPQSLPISETELCSLLSNSLENAIAAATGLPPQMDRTVTLRSSVYQGKLLLAVDNPYTGEVTIKDGLPQAAPNDADVQIHGYGTRSIAGIAKLHSGQALFTAQDGVFSLKIMLPLSPDAYF